MACCFLALADEKGTLIWISSARPGRSSEITAARHDKITAHLRKTGLGALADLGFVGLDDEPDDHPVIAGRKATRNHKLTEAENEANRHAQPRTRRRRAWLRELEILAHPHQGPHEHPPRDHPPAGLLVLANTEVQR
ncbi:hypothetical protein ABT025_13355 [Streptomyces sp. NPDC002809]|uniref:hypothetical protein n=1 Tax=Streptomyces sp. NPDC002809 TaxID=3154433 RepID=UPI0033283FDE